MRLIRKKECSVLVWQAKLLILLICAILFYLLFFDLPRHLSKSDPVYGSYLVLDGQMPDYSIEKAIELINTLDYDTIITTGGALDAGYFLNGQKTMADLSYSTFLVLGFDSTRIHKIPGGRVYKNRTYTSALSLKNYFSKQKITTAKIDMLAIGCHASRSQYLFQKALGENFDVGVYAIPDKSYDIEKWWKSSKGARTVLSESIAYFYVRLFFKPD